MAHSATYHTVYNKGTEEAVARNFLLSTLHLGTSSGCQSTPYPDPGGHNNLFQLQVQDIPHTLIWFDSRSPRLVSRQRQRRIDQDCHRSMAQIECLHKYR